MGFSLSTLVTSGTRFCIFQLDSFLCCFACAVDYQAQIADLDKDDSHVFTGLRTISVAGLQLSQGVEGVKVVLDQQARHHFNQQHRLLKVCIDIMAAQADDMQNTLLSSHAV